MKAVLWDLDGTILDPRGSIRATLDAVVAEAGFRRFDQSEVLIGQPLRQILGHRTTDAKAIDVMVHRFREVYMERMWAKAAVYDGLTAALDQVQGTGAKMALVTTKGQEETEFVVHRFGLTRFFDALIGDDDVMPTKPDSAPVLAACEALGVAPSDAVMIGDTAVDVAAGRAAGCKTIGVAWGHGGHAEMGVHDADVVVDTPADLLAAVRQLAGGSDQAT